MVLVTGEDETGRQELARQAGCFARATESKVEVPLCCPASLEAPAAARTGGGKSCEQARQEYVAAFDPKAVKDAPAPEVTAGMHGMILNLGQYLVVCSVADTSGVTICAAVQHGRVQGVTVRTMPASIEMADCVARTVRGMSFPAHPRMDVTRTTFAPSE
ncbi:MAG: hypothetical protein JW751_25050 [Polyangiaceae bacterium]|nr:hypothetical protein [Polyangiaceae bacterium]